MPHVSGRTTLASLALALVLGVFAASPVHAQVATDPAVNPSGYGLGRHGWIAFSVDEDAGEERWRVIEEWVRTSYTLVAPKRLARLVE